MSVNMESEIDDALKRFNSAAEFAGDCIADVETEMWAVVKLAREFATALTAAR